MTFWESDGCKVPQNSVPVAEETISALAGDAVTDSDMTDWQRLQHAYGPASDVPSQLATLASASEEERKHAYQKCYSNIFHQGTRYSASVAVIPVLFRLAQSLDTPNRGDIINLLLHIAVGYPQYHVSRGFDFANRKPQTGGKSSNAGRCYRGVEERLADLHQLLTDRESAVRVNVAHALAYFRPASVETLQKLTAITLADDSLTARATAAISLGALTRSLHKENPQPRTESLLRDSSLDPHEHPMVRFGTSIGLAYLIQKRLSAESTTTTLSLLRLLPRDTGIPWMCHDMQCLAASVFQSLAAAGNATAFNALEELTTDAFGENAVDVSTFLFALLFPRPVAETDTLSAPQINALRIALNNSSLWRDGVSNYEPCQWAPEILRQVGIGNTKRDIERRATKGS